MRSPWKECTVLKLWVLKSYISGKKTIGSIFTIETLSIYLKVYSNIIGYSRGNTTSSFFFYFIIYKTMFLDSLLGIPSQIISTTGGLLNNIIAIPGQLVGSVTSSIGGTIGAVSNVAGNTIGAVANTTGQTLQGVASTVTNLLSSPVVIVGVGIVLVILLKK